MSAEIVPIATQIIALLRDSSLALCNHDIIFVSALMPSLASLRFPNCTLPYRHVRSAAPRDDDQQCRLEPNPCHGHLEIGIRMCRFVVNGSAARFEIGLLRGLFPHPAMCPIDAGNTVGSSSIPEKIELFASVKPRGYQRYYAHYNPLRLSLAAQRTALE